MELLVSCGFGQESPQPGRYSFTRCLIDVLDKWRANRKPFTTAVMHREILSELLDLYNIDRIGGRNGQMVNLATAPIHITLQENSTGASISIPNLRYQNVLRFEDNCTNTSRDGMGGLNVNEGESK